MTISTHDTFDDHDDPEPGSTWFIGLAGSIVFTALVLAISVLYFGVTEERTDEVVIDRPTRSLQQLRLSQEAQIQGPAERYTVLDADGKALQRIRIPVAEAMEILVRDGLPAAPPTAPAAQPAVSSGAGS